MSRIGEKGARGASPAAFARFSMRVGARRAALLAVAVAALAFPYAKAFQASFPRASACDLIVWACDPFAGPLPLLWFACPVASMLALAAHWHDTESYHTAVRHAGSRGRWLAQCCDAAGVSLVAAISVLAALIVWGMLLFGPLCDFDAAGSLFARETGGAVGADFSPALFLSAALAYAFLALLCANVAFCLLCALFKRTLPAFACAALAGLPDVHGQGSFIYDVMHNVSGGSLAIPNPLSLLYGAASIDYSAWTPQGDLRLWALLVEAAVFAVLGWALSKRRDYFS